MGLTPKASLSLNDGLVSMAPPTRCARPAGLAASLPDRPLRTRESYEYARSESPVKLL
jgi:hypothetical protein